MSDLSELRRELAERELNLAVSERAYVEGRVADTQKWIRSLLRQRIQIIDLRDMIEAAKQQ